MLVYTLHPGARSRPDSDSPPQLSDGTGVPAERTPQLSEKRLRVKLAGRKRAAHSAVPLISMQGFRANLCRPLDHLFRSRDDSRRLPCRAKGRQELAGAQLRQCDAHDTELGIDLERLRR